LALLRRLALLAGAACALLAQATAGSLLAAIGTLLLLLPACLFLLALALDLVCHFKAPSNVRPGACGR